MSYTPGTPPNPYGNFNFDTLNKYTYDELTKLSSLLAGYASAATTTAISVDASNNVTLSANLSFSGTGSRIQGDFSNATLSNRLAIQTSTTNGVTNVHIIPNGTATQCGLKLEMDPAIANGSFGTMDIIGYSDFRISSSIRGTGAYLPTTFWVGGAEAMRIDTSKNVLVTGAGGFGYGTGSGGTVTQLTSKSTNVTLNTPSGRITMNNAALGASAAVRFYLSNSSISAYTDVVIVQVIQSGNYTAQNYRIDTYPGSGTCLIQLTNISAGSLSDAVQLEFAVIKGATA